MLFGKSICYNKSNSIIFILRYYSICNNKIFVEQQYLC